MAIDRAAVLRNADTRLRQGKLDGALAEYLRVVEEQPSDWNIANTLGDLCLRAGQTDRAVQQFVRIADSLSCDGFLPKAAALYKKILKILQRQERQSSVEWLECAVQSPVVDAVEARALFCELADTLESMNERARALAIFLELQAEAGHYRDVSERIER